ncbi:Calcium binding protein CalD OS=Streptomyces tendae OX=1932 GN=calD PE=4 SV=1 [Streptomyces tendae]
MPEDLARPAAAALDTDGDGRIGEAEIVPAFARYFTVPE